MQFGALCLSPSRKRLPHFYGHTAQEIFSILLTQGSYLLSYIVSFIVLGMFWTSHNVFFHYFSRTVNRVLIQLNMIYLMFIALIPFSAFFLGTYLDSKIAISVYGINIIIIGTVAFGMYMYALYAHDIDTSLVPSRVINQARIRILLPPLFAIIGLMVMWLNTDLALFFFAFPVVFNILPGSLDYAERVLGIKLV